MTTATAKSRFFHKLLAAAVLAAGLGGIALSSTPAQAHDGWYGDRGRYDWRGHEWRGHEWREHRGWYRPYYGYGYSYYAPAPRYYYPPAVVYAPPPASFNVVIPFH